MEYNELNSVQLEEENNIAKTKIISLLREKNAILMVGSGSSKIVDYPLWGELIENLRKNFTPNLDKPPKDICLELYADKIKDQIINEGKIKEYHKFLEKTFQPKKTSNHTQFHCALVKLGFCGIVTTNYDIVLETAVMDAFSNDCFHLCVPQDLCLSKPYRVFDFLRSISSKNDHSSVLHLHGCYNNSEEIVLTRRDYLKRYGEIQSKGSNDGFVGILDTNHKKVIWSLLTMKTLVFVGFSMTDPFFMDIIDIVQNDFQLDNDIIHLAIMPYESSLEREKTYLSLKKKGILPVFYYVPKLDGSNKTSNHSGLEKLIFELADTIGVDVGSSSYRILTQRMLDR